MPPRPPQEGLPPLLQPAWLEAHAVHPAADDVVLVQVDEDGSSYHQAHIPGAMSFDWVDDLQDRESLSFLGRRAFERLMDSRGIRAHTHVVLYGDADNRYAAAAYWYLRYYRHRAVSLLDGGLPRWAAEGRPVTDEPTPTPDGGGYRVNGVEDAILVRRDEMLRMLVARRDDRALVVVDCRSPAEFRGELYGPQDLPLDRPSHLRHIPSAVNLPATAVVDPATRRFRSAAELSELAQAAGLSPDREVVVYCRVGERSLLVWFALHEVLGYPRVRNYNGGWAEYSNLSGVAPTA